MISSGPEKCWSFGSEAFGLSRHAEDKLRACEERYGKLERERRRLSDDAGRATEDRVRELEAQTAVVRQKVRALQVQLYSPVRDCFMWLWNLVPGKPRQRLARQRASG